MTERRRLYHLQQGPIQSSQPGHGWRYWLAGIAVLLMSVVFCTIGVLLLAVWAL